jgi:hypothetical protein
VVTHPRPSLLVAGNYLNDLYRFSLTSNTWTNRTATRANTPSSRTGMGFAATPNGMLYVFGGRDRRLGEPERGEDERLVKICHKSEKIRLHDSDC